MVRTQLESSALQKLEPVTICFTAANAPRAEVGLWGEVQVKNHCAGFGSINYTGITLRTFL